MPSAALAGLDQTEHLLTSHPADAAAWKVWNLEVRKLVVWYDSLPVSSRTAACRAAGLSVEIDGSVEHGMRHFMPVEAVPAHRLKRNHSRPGIGVPVVGWRANDGSGKWDAIRPPEGISAACTAVADRRTGGGWTLKFLSPAVHETVPLEGRMYPLAANFTAPFAALLAHADALRHSGLHGMLNPAKSLRKEKLYLMQPYDPRRIPLVMVHGLQSTPIAFANLLNDLQADPVIGARYQIWHYYYPTGTAVMRNAAVMRKVIDETLRALDPRGNDFATSHLVMLGHSMGGILSHALVCDSGYKLWDSLIRVRPDKFRGPVEARKGIMDILIFQRNPRVRRVIFVAVPHRGSTTADHWLGNLGNRLLHPDESLIGRFRPLLEYNRGQLDPFVVNLLEKGKFSSIRTLSPRSPALQALAAIPPAVPFHSIIGQLGAGDYKTGSDGFVKYSSSHLDGAESELIVHSGHNAFRKPEAVEEIKRILRLHLRKMHLRSR